jgi:hypothetical protein
MPGQRVRIARKNDPGPVARENLERCGEDVAHHAFKIVGGLDRAVDPIHRLQEPYVFAMLGFSSLSLGDVAADAAIAEEAPRLIEHRHPGDGVVNNASVRDGYRALEIAKREVRVDRCPVVAPTLFVEIDMGMFPARLADLRSRERRRIARPLG